MQQSISLFNDQSPSDRASDMLPGQQGQSKSSGEDKPMTLVPCASASDDANVKPKTALPRTTHSIDLDAWDDALPPETAADDADLNIFSNLDSEAPAVLALDDGDVVFADFPDAAILEQYLDYTDVFDPSLTELLDVDFTSELSVTSKRLESEHDEAYVFKSPLAWVADWAVDNLRSDRRFEVVEQRVFNLPQNSEIATLLKLYFSHAHHRLPVLNEHSFYLLTDQRRRRPMDRSLEPISLALLYALMFFACSYLRTESTDVSYTRAIRSMRCEYYSRAATLFKLGCEADPLRQVQICLLLSTYRNYPGQFYENERWIIKAYRILQDAGALPSKTPDRGFVDEPDWKRACACWLHRFSNSHLGLKWTNSPELMAASQFPWHQITVADFEADFSFSWYLSAEIKRQLTHMFVDRIEMNLHFCQLGKVLWKRTATEMLAIGESLAAVQDQPSDALPIEEIEVRLQKWKQDHGSLFSMEPVPNTSPSEKRLLRAEQILLKLTYE
jgi:hypothetical protein